MRSTPSHLVLALAAVLALPAAAGDSNPPAAPKKGEAAAPAMKAHVDPVTGALVPAPPQATKAALAAAPVQPLPALKVQAVKAKPGGKMVRLDDRFTMEMTESVGPDGKVSHSCEAEHEKKARRER